VQFPAFPEAGELVQILLYLPAQGNRVEVMQECLHGSALRAWKHSRGQEPLVGSLGTVVTFEGPGSKAFLGDQFADGAQEVQLESVEAVKLLKCQEGRPGAIAIMPDESADGQPVALLDIGLIVLAVAPSPGHSDSLVSAPADKPLIEELRPIVDVPFLQREWESSTDVADSTSNPFQTEPPDGLQLGPAGSNIHGSQGGEAETCDGLAAVEHKVTLQGPWGSILPLSESSQRDLFLQCVGRGGLMTMRLAAEAVSGGLEQAIDGGRAKWENLASVRRGETKFLMSFQRVNQDGESSNEEFGARSVTDFPESGQVWSEIMAVETRAAGAFSSWRRDAMEHANGWLAVKAGDATELVEELSFLCTRRGQVTRSDHRGVLLQALSGHAASFRTDFSVTGVLRHRPPLR
jgi:hypothetical protein